MIASSAPAKINLVFQVAPLGSDGYHEVNSLYLELDLREKITLIQTGKPVNILVSSNTLPSRHVNAVPTDQSNLVYRVGKLLFNNAGLEFTGVEILIEKHIPVAGGMAGGSADAAAMLKATNHFLHEVHGTELLTDSELLEQAKDIGSDVPFSFLGGLAIGRGRGEQLEKLPELSFPTYWVLAVSQEGLSTPLVYSRFDELGKTASFIDLTEPIENIQALANLMQNDLEPASITLLPSIRNTIDALELSGSLKAMVSGSGPTVMGLFDSKDKALAATEMLQKMGLVGLVVEPSYAGTRLER